MLATCILTLDSKAANDRSDIRQYCIKNLLSLYTEGALVVEFLLVLLRSTFASISVTSPYYET